jgi:hypothetical protein
MNMGRRALGSVLVAVALVVAGCSSGPSGSPTDTVKEVFRLIEAGQLDKVADLSCAASKDKAAKAFDFAGALAGSLPPGMDAQQVAAAIRVTTSGLTITEESKTDKAASVRIKGTVTIVVDAEKFKPILKGFLEASGQTADDATIAAALAQMSGILSSDQALDTTADVISEGGSWKICE